LGENRPKLAKRYFFLTLAITTVSAWTLIFIIYLLRSSFASIYFSPTDKPQLNAMLASGIAIMCFCYICDLM
jgi:Na+-driven multidrug efflux pump